MSMSKAFVREGEEQLRPSNPLPDRPIPSAPNLVSPQGLAEIEMRIDRLEEEQRKARAANDADAIGRTARDLRYWSAQRASARVVEAPSSGDEVRFGSTVVVERPDGQMQSYRIVGVDEADPAQGTISHISPLARELLSKTVGDEIAVGRTRLTIREVQ
jgi:transcription elongation GreA/GreB family factor